MYLGELKSESTCCSAVWYEESEGRQFGVNVESDFMNVLKDFLIDKSLNQIDKPSLWDIRRWLLENEYEEVYKSEVPYFKKVVADERR